MLKSKGSGYLSQKTDVLDGPYDPKVKENEKKLVKNRKPGTVKRSSGKKTTGKK